jgi:hypothetical protein
MSDQPGREPGTVTGDNPEFDYTAMPRQYETARGEAQERWPDMVTEYEQIDPCTEKLTWTQPDGSGASWRQRWMCGLAAAPPVGTLFAVTHDEWELEDDGVYLRIIHSFRLPDEGDTPDVPA